MRLREMAHARTGDKGNISNISVIAYRSRGFRFSARAHHRRACAGAFADIVRGPVERYELPVLGALNFVLHGALCGGVTRSLALDAHGKSLSSCLLEMEVPDLQRAAFR